MGSDIPLKRLPLSRVILDLLARQANRQEPLKGSDLAQRGPQLVNSPVSLGLGSIPARESFLESCEIVTKFNLGLHLAAEDPQRLQLLRIQLPGHAIRHTQGSNRLPVRGERSARIKPNLGVQQNQGTLRESFIPAGIWNHKDVALKNGPGTERNIAGCFRLRNTDFRLKPLPVSIHQAD